MEKLEGDALKAYLTQLPELEKDQELHVEELDTKASQSQWYVLASSVKSSGGLISGLFARSLSEACEAREYKTFQTSAIVIVDSAPNCNGGRTVHRYTFE